MTPFVILAIDQADLSGWCVMRAPEGAWLDSGTADGGASGFADRARVVARFLELAGDAPARVVFEDHSDFYFGRGNASVGSLLGMGAARGRWEESLLRVLKPSWMRDKVTPKVWRRAVLGLPSGARADRCKAVAQTWAAAKAGRPMPDDNEAEAVCIAAWAARNVKVGPRAKGRAA